MRAATEGNLPPVMPQGTLVEVVGREVRQELPEELMVESPPSRQRRPPCKTNKEMSDEAADAAALTYLLTYLRSSAGVRKHNRSFNTSGIGFNSQEGVPNSSEECHTRQKNCKTRKIWRSVHAEQVNRQQTGLRTTGLLVPVLVKNPGPAECYAGKAGLLWTARSMRGGGQGWESCRPYCHHPGILI